MKIRSIEASAFRLPNRRSFKWAGLNVELGGFVLVRVTTDDGLVGYGRPLHCRIGAAIGAAARAKRSRRSSAS